jgi:CheY-like chemotaxis protein
VLIVENDTRLRLDLALRLGRMYDVAAVASAREALDLVSFGAAFDVILCELTLPETSGVKLCEQLAQVDPGLASRVVVMFDLCADPLLRRALEVLPNPRIARPFEEEALIGLLEAHRGRAASRDLESAAGVGGHVDAASVFALAVRLTRGERLDLVDRDGWPWQASATTLAREMRDGECRPVVQGCAADVALEIVRRGLRARGRPLLASGA